MKRQGGRERDNTWVDSRAKGEERGRRRKKGRRESGEDKRERVTDNTEVDPRE